MKKAGPLDDTYRVGGGEWPRADEAVRLGPGDTVGDRYRLVEVLGAGGMGEVWRAERTSEPGQFVALKLLKETGLSDLDRRELRARFRLEARLLSELDNPSIVQALDHGEGPDGCLFIAMELLEGYTLREHLQRESRLGPVEVLNLIDQVGGAIMSAHDKGLIHRDLKPGNIFLSPDGDGSRIRLLDFGIAKTLESGDLEGGPRTRTGMIVGSPHYMAPEQFEGKPCPATDIYALGVLAWECLAGHRPFEGTTASVVGKHLMQEPPEFSPELEIPEELESLVLEMLEKRPEHRPRSIRHVLTRAQAIREGLSAPLHQRRRWPALTAVLAMSWLGLVITLWDHGTDVAAAAGRLLNPGTQLPEGMVAVEGGPFFMGCSPASDPGCETKAGALGRTVEVATFAIDRTEVTVLAYANCVAQGACTAGQLNRPVVDGTPRPDQEKHCNWGRSGQESHPINCVTWFEAANYCAFRGARLPTEAEWEKAARGTDARRLPWGNRLFDYREANIADLSARRKHRWPFASRSYNDLRPNTAPAGELAAGASPYGAIDMVGNVWEWTAGVRGVSRRPFRGASFLEGPDTARVTSRAQGDPTSRGVNLGFRCAKTL